MPATAAPSSLRPPLKWAGGKRWQVPHLRPLWDAHANAGSSSRSAAGWPSPSGFCPNGALLNDANPHLINFYRWLQKGLKTDLKMENNERLFYRQRTRFNELVADGQEDTAEGAALFYYLNRTGFNGLCRFNSKGEFNVPFGRYARIGYTHDFTRTRMPSRTGNSPTPISRPSGSPAMTSSTPIRPTTSSSPRIPRADSRGTIRSERRNGSRATRAR